MRPIFRQSLQKWPFSDKKVNKRYFLKPKLCKKTLKSIFLQKTSVKHIFYTKTNVYKSITISFNRIYECILRFVFLILIRKVWLQQVNKKCGDVSKKKKGGTTSWFYNATSENVLPYFGTARAESIFLSRELSSLVSFC